MNAFLRVCAALLIILVAGAGLTACGGDDQDDRPGVDLPPDFPVDAVPLIDGSVMAATGEGKGWRLTIQADASSPNPLENAVTTLTDRGYEESSRVGDSAHRSVLLSDEIESKTYWVNVGIAADASGSRSSIFYNITRTE